MDKTYNAYKNGAYQGTFIPDGTRLLADGDDFIFITPGGYTFKIYDVDRITFLGKEDPNGQTI